ncbi:hypothetical protein OH77DRAFT_1518619 [Trametes cingulata]|nr:hypothetical protein OH77DRAFT_1518619 [Trametes cingulata]
MDPGYPYYTATSTGQDQSSGQHHPPRHQQNPGYARPPEQSSPAHGYPYSHAQLPPVVSGSYNHAYPQQQQQHQHQQGPSYHSPLPHGSMSGTLPPITQGQGYSRGATQASRYDAGPQGGYVPSLGPTLHELPFARPTSAGQPVRSSSYGPSQSSSSRSPPLYDRQAIPSSATYPPPRHGIQHPSLSHSTQLIPTPAQTYHGYSSGSSSPGGSMPVIASIPPASGAVAPQERYYCDKCEKSFGRAHDKKRHYESAHLQTHHECRFCHKCFSRNDSLKRHQDNGCEKDPSFQS